MTLSKRDLPVVVAGLAGAVACALVLAGLPRVWPGRNGAAAPRGTRVVVITDDAKTTVQEGAVLDGPQFDALRAKGMAAVRSTAWPRLKQKGYDQLVAQAGGTPALIVLTADGQKVYAGKLPADEAKLQALLAKYVTGLPPPLPLARPARVVDPGQAAAVAGDVATVNGTPRKLAARPGGAKLRATLPRYADSHPVYPESQWHDVDRRNVFPWAAWGLDQGQHGSCVANACSAALGKRRWLAGMTPVKLSPAFLYSLINGGRDEGAVISDGLAALTQTGTCSFAVVGQEPIYARQMPPKARQDAGRFKATDGYHVQTWQELGSAVQTGQYTVVFGVQVGTPNGGQGNWTRFDRYGVAGHDAGPGNHALHADGMRRLPDGRWVLDVPNSWGGDWGPFKTGRVYLDKQHLFGGGDQPDICVFRAASDDPLDPLDPPAYKPAGK